MSIIAKPSVAVPIETEHWTGRHLKAIIFIVVAIAAFGLYEASQIPIAVFPATNFPRIIVGIENGVMPVDQMQVTITRPIEEAVNSVPGLDHVVSVTSRGEAEVDLFFRWNVDMFRTLQSVNAAIASIGPTLPPTANITVNRMTFAAFPIMGYSLTSSSIPQTRLWEIANYTLKPELNRLQGVSMVVVQGGQVPEFQIEPDPEKLVESQITIPNLLDAFSKSNLIDSPGFIEHNHQLVLTLVSGQAQDASGIGQMIIKTSPSGVPIQIADVAKVYASMQPAYTAVTAKGKPAVLLNIFRQPESNTVAVANEVHAEIERIKRALPPYCWHDPPRAGFWRGLANAPTSGNRSNWWSTSINGTFLGDYTRCALFPNEKSERYVEEKLKRTNIRDFLT